MHTKNVIYKFLIVIFFILSAEIVKSENNSYVVLKINNQIITNIDIENEKKYLLAINPNLVKLDSTKMIDVAKQSLIREMIKKNELKKYADLNVYANYLPNILKDFYTKLNFQDIESLENYFLSKNLQIKTVKDKLNIEALWNELIYNRYNNKVEIDVNKLRSKIKEQIYEEDLEFFLISEIVFTASNKSEVKIKHDEIKKSINEIGFDNTANIYSVSETAKFGGKIGWVNKNRITENIANNLKNLNVGDYSNLINVPGGFLIIKILDQKFEKVKINEENELKKLISSEKDRQLNEFSSIYFQKIKKNSLINEK